MRYLQVISPLMLLGISTFCHALTCKHVDLNHVLLYSSFDRGIEAQVGSLIEHKNTTLCDLGFMGGCAIIEQGLNLAPNPSFETTSGWEKLKIASTGALFDLNAGYHTWLGRADAVISEPIDVKPDSWYTVSGYLKNGFYPFTTYYIDLGDMPGDIHAYPPSYAREWVRVAATAKTGPGVDKIRLRIVADQGNKGKLWFDGLQLVCSRQDLPYLGEGDDRLSYAPGIKDEWGTIALWFKPLPIEGDQLRGCLFHLAQPDDNRTLTCMVGYEDGNITAALSWDTYVKKRSRRCSRQAMYDWHNAAMTRQGNEYRLYLDGLYCINVSLADEHFSPTELALHPRKGSLYLNCYIDELMVLSHAMQSSQIIRIYMLTQGIDLNRNFVDNKSD